MSTASSMRCELSFARMIKASLYCDVYRDSLCCSKRGNSGNMVSWTDDRCSHPTIGMLSMWYVELGTSSTSVFGGPKIIGRSTQATMAFCADTERLLIKSFSPWVGGLVALLCKEALLQNGAVFAHNLSGSLIHTLAIS